MEECKPLVWGVTWPDTLALSYCSQATSGAGTDLADSSLGQAIISQHISIAIDSRRHSALPGCHDCSVLLSVMLIVIMDTLAAQDT